MRGYSLMPHFGCRVTNAIWRNAMKQAEPLSFLETSACKDKALAVFRMMA
jgi:hypothetical protein